MKWHFVIVTLISFSKPLLLFHLSAMFYRFVIPLQKLLKTSANPKSAKKKKKAAEKAVADEAVPKLVEQ